MAGRPFDGFLHDKRARPLGLRIFGHATSLAIHAPPLTVFMIAWLTKALVLDHALELPEYRRSRSAFYQVPVTMIDGVPGEGAGFGGRSASAPAALAGGDLGGPRGKSGIGKRRSRRPLHLPANHRRVRRGPQEKPAAIGPEEMAYEDGLAWDANGVGHAIDGDGAGAGRASEGAGASKGGGPHAAGGGTGAQSGAGLAAANVTAPGDAEKRLAAWVPPEPRRKVRARAERGSGEGDDIEDSGPDDEALVGAPLPGRPSRVSMNYAAYLRTYEPFPTLPDSCWPPGRSTNTVMLEICVSERGDVSDVVVRESAGEEVDHYLTAAVRTWRYRPRIVQGSPRPFCHPIRLVYTRALRFDRHW